MTETAGDLGWIERLPTPQASQMIVIRHGESRYHEEGLDLTDSGVAQVKASARELGPYLKNFDNTLVITSPAPRAISTADIFLEEVGLQLPKKLAIAVRPLGIKDLKGFLEYDRLHSTSIYGQMYLTDPFLADNNPLIEARKNVDYRSQRFLYHYGKQIDRISKATDRKIAVLVFTHNEVGTNFLQGIYPDSDNFPIEQEKVLQNAEPVIIQLDNPTVDEYTIMARDRIVKVKYDKEKQGFIPAK